MATFKAGTYNVMSISNSNGSMEFKIKADSQIKLKEGTNTTSEKCGYNDAIVTSTPQPSVITGVKVAMNVAARNFLKETKDRALDSSITLISQGMGIVANFQGKITGDTEWDFNEGITEVELTATGDVDMDQSND